jgi:hypothetical protein
LPSATGTYKPSDKSASLLFLELLRVINGGRLALLDHRRTLNQLIGSSAAPTCVLMVPQQTRGRRELT